MWHYNYTTYQYWYIKLLSNHYKSALALKIVCQEAAIVTKVCKLGLQLHIAQKQVSILGLRKTLQQKQNMAKYDDIFDLIALWKRRRIKSLEEKLVKRLKNGKIGGLLVQAQTLRRKIHLTRASQCQQKQKRVLAYCFFSSYLFSKFCARESGSFALAQSPSFLSAKRSAMLLFLLFYYYTTLPSVAFA